MQRICERCGEVCQNQNVYVLHQLGVERCFKEGQPIAERLHRSIETTKGQVHFLLLSKPATRGKYQILYGYHRCIFQGTHYFDHHTNSFVPKQSIYLSKAKYVVDEQTLGRRARELQEEDRKIYHKKLMLADGTIEYLAEWKQPHECILPSAQTMLKREILQEATRNYYSR